jgi:hypothetical protein
VGSTYTTDFAAKNVNDLTLSGKSDLFLPCIGEMDEFYNNIIDNADVSNTNLPLGRYWTSTDWIYYTTNPLPPNWGFPGRAAQPAESQLAESPISTPDIPGIKVIAVRTF